jgi:hypothetical protein
MTEQLLTASEVAEQLRSSTDTLKYWRFIGKGPNWLRVGRHILYRQSALDAYLESVEMTTQVRKSMSSTPPAAISP